MKIDRPTPDQLFDEAVAAVNHEPIDSATVAAALGRVERRLAAEQNAPADGAPDHRIRGCAGFQALIPAYLAAALSEPQRILFEDHTRECVPCRRALGVARKGRPLRAAADDVRSRGWQRLPLVARWALAAGLGGLIIAGGVTLSGRLGLVGPDASAKVRAIEGELLALDGGGATPLAAGATIERGRTVRTGAGAGAVLELADGSRVELAARSELRLARRADGVVLALDRGALIVEAAQQKRGHLYVQTDDCTVSVVGTIFSVNHGVRGSRVAVLDGEVNVRQGARLAVLRPGDQLATQAQLTRIALGDEIGWSRNAAAYRERIAALAALGRELDATLATVGERTSTRLLDLAPAGTVIWAGLPNLTGQLAEAWTLLERRVGESPVLAGWWAEQFGSGDAAHEIAFAVDKLRELGGHLGAEVAVAVTLAADGSPSAPVLMAEVVDGSGFAAILDAEIVRLNEKALSQDASAATGEKLVRIESLDGALPQNALLIWLAADDLLIVSPSAEGLRAVAAALPSGSGGFTGSPFHSRLAQVYTDGAGWLLGVDAGAIVARTAQMAAEQGDQAVAALDRLGLAAAEHLIIESATVNGAIESRATLAFRGARTGLASWLAAPAASGALDFISADASFALGGLVKRPAAMFDDLFAAAMAHGNESPAVKLAEIEAKLGFSLRDDFAAAFGGDFAVALDGPWLPKPSWKVVVEVVDPARLEYAVTRAIEAWNSEVSTSDQPAHPALRFSQEESSGRLFYRLATESGVELAQFALVDGYLVAAPSRALILESIQRRAAGATLAASSAFLDRLPRDADPNFSAMVWQNLGGAIGQIGQLLAGQGVAAEERERLAQLASESGPTLVVAYAAADRIGFVAQGQNGPFGFSFEKLLAILGATSARSDDAEGMDAEGAVGGNDETLARSSA